MPGFRTQKQSANGARFRGQFAVGLPLNQNGCFARGSGRFAAPLILPATFFWTATITEAIFPLEEFCLCDR
jgi:hypothetical protein